MSPNSKMNVKKRKVMSKLSFSHPSKMDQRISCSKSDLQIHLVKSTLSVSYTHTLSLSLCVYMCLTLSLSMRVCSWVGGLVGGWVFYCVLSIYIPYLCLSISRPSLALSYNNHHSTHATPYTRNFLIAEKSPLKTKKPSQQL